MGAMGAYNDAQQEQRRNALVDLQRQKLEAEMRDPQMFGKIDPSDFTTESLAKFQLTKNYGDLVLNPRNSKAPSSVLEYDFFSKLPEAERERFLTLKRNPQQVPIGGVPHQIIGGVPYPLSTLEKEAQGKATVAGARKSAETGAAAATTAQLDLPAAEARIPVIEKQLETLLNHPGRKYATGPLAAIPRIPGTPQADFINRHEQFKSVAFLQAFETLKGGGQITEIEGEKATQAMNRMDRATTDKEYEAAARDFLAAYKAGVQKLKDKASFPSGYMNPKEQAGARFDNVPTGEKIKPAPGGFRILGVED
jgi:hypothetical protein